MTQDAPETKAAESTGAPSGLHRHGKVSYLQIPAVDVEQSGAFYEKVFGWQIRGDIRHLSFEDSSGEFIGAWVTDHEIGHEPGLLPYIYVDGIDNTLEQVAANGGDVVRTPSPMATCGWRPSAIPPAT